MIALTPPEEAVLGRIVFQPLEPQRVRVAHPAPLNQEAFGLLTQATWVGGQALSVTAVLRNGVRASVDPAIVEEAPATVIRGPWRPRLTAAGGAA